MQVSVKKKNGVEGSYVDISVTLPELIKRTPLPPPTAQTPPPAKREVVEPKVEQMKPQPPKVISKRPSILNLGELLSGNKEGSVETMEPQSVEGGSPQVQESETPQQTAQRLESAREAIMRYLAQWRPRFIAVFEAMRIESNTIHIAVPTVELKEEIMRGETEFLTRVVELSGVRTRVELKIEVSEEVKSSKPIKLEDRIAYIIEKNPLVAELREVLDLDIEG